MKGKRAIKISFSLAIGILIVAIVMLYYVTQNVVINSTAHKNLGKLEMVAEKQSLENIKNTKDEISAESTKINEDIEHEKDEKTPQISEGVENNEELQNEETANAITQENSERDNVETTTNNQEFSMYVEYNSDKIQMYKKDNIDYLFLPKDINIANLAISYTGEIESVNNANLNKETKQITGNFQNESSFTVKLTDSQEKNVIIMQSNLPTIYLSGIKQKGKSITLQDVNNAEKKEKYQVNVFIPEGENAKDDINEEAELKGRGNFTWTLPKRGYQIKFNEERNLFDMGMSESWVLLANYTDNSLIRNKLTSDLAKDINLEYTQNSMWVDFWVDGQYQGNYLLSEKVESGIERVNLTNNTGLIAEVDNIYYSKSDDPQFISQISQTHFVYKDGKKNKTGKAYFTSDFEEYINRFENALYSDTRDWNEIKSLIDVESFAKYYFIQEFTENADAARTSMYMYKDGENDVLHMGPVWDFDIALGNCIDTNWGGNPELDYIPNITSYRSASIDWYPKLLEIPEFRKEISNLYNNQVKNVLSTAVDKVTSYQNELQISAKMNFIRWDTLGTENAINVADKTKEIGHKNKETYNEEVQYLKDWIQKRVEYLDKRYDKNSEIYTVKYKSHIQGMGWETDFAQNGQMSGTVGVSKRLEAITISMCSFNEKLIEKNAHIKYQVYSKDTGWQDWKQDGENAGTIGQGKIIEAIKIMLCDDSGNPIDYSIKYNVHLQIKGWQEWKYNGEEAGTIGEDRRLEAIQIEMEEGRENLGNKNINQNALINYRAHIQRLGNTGYGSDGEIIGTIGQRLRMEGLEIKLNEKLLPNVSLDIDAHIQRQGWIKGTDNEFIGTEGQSTRLEALKLKLKGQNAENYSIKYRVYVENSGWQEWKQDGELAGTENQSKRIEAIQIKIVKK